MENTREGKVVDGVRQVTHRYMRFLAHTAWAVLFVFMCTPHISAAAVILSEVAWMGTDADANNEWIEIYNLSTSPADVTGWTLTDGGSISITLSGTLTPHGVGVLERTDDATLPGTAFMIYTGALSNSGGTLTLKDASGAVADQAVGGENWSGIGGRNTVPKMTAQRTRTGAWVTGLPTPGAENVQQNDPNAGATTTGSTNEQTENKEGNTTVQKTSTQTVVQRSSGGGSNKTPFAPSTARLSLAVEVPDAVYVNAPVTLTAVPSGIGKTITESLTYTWNFGDTYTGEGKKVTHTYTYPGEYIVVLEAQYSRHNERVEKMITVRSVPITLSRSATNDVVLTNTASYDVDVSGYTLKTERSSFRLPSNTMIRAGKAITISRDRIGVTGTEEIVLTDAAHERVASTAQTFASRGAAEESPRVHMAVSERAPVRTAHVASVEASPLTPIGTYVPDTQDAVTDDADAAREIAQETIPLYQGASAGQALTENGTLRSKLPYLGFVLIVIVGVLLLNTRKSDTPVS